MLVLGSPAFLLLLAAPPALLLFTFIGQNIRLLSTHYKLQASLRCVGLVLLIIALAQPGWRRSSSGSSVVLVFDTSNSITDADRAVEARWLATGATEASTANPVTTVFFAGSASAVILRKPPNPDQIADLLKPVGNATETDLEGALRFAAELVPPGSRLILLTDGDQTVGDAEAAVPGLQAADISLDTVLLNHQADDVTITRLTVPPFSPSGSELPTQITVTSTRQVTATLTLQVDGQNVGSQALSVQPGNNPYVIGVPPPSAGPHVVAVTIKASDDAIPQNNTLDAVTDVTGIPRVLVVASASAKSVAVGLFRDSNLTITAVRPGAMPGSAAKLTHYDSIVLDDIPATALNAAQISALDTAVKQDGVGLYVLGGSHSLTQGHYGQTALEKLLPVLSETPASLQDGNVALQLVLDRSGSMDDLAGDVPKIVMARNAAQLAASFVIQHQDDLGLVAFDQASHILIPTGKVSVAAKTHVAQIIAGITSDGGTNIYQALQTGIQQVSKSTAPYRHIILMTDGRSDPANYLPLLQEAQKLQITISTVGLGADADVQLLHYIAAEGKGRFYYTSNASDLPNIFAQETRLAAGSAEVIGKIGVKIATNSPDTRSLGATPLPQLSGYTATVLKSTAVNDLETNVAGRKPDPLLARWDYGLGRVLVWTPGVENKWAAIWRKAEPTFWSNTLRWTLRGPTVPTYEPALGGGSVPNSIQIDTLKNSGTAVDLRRLAVDVRTPAGATAHLTATQTAPGLYEAAYTFPGAGVYEVMVRAITGKSIQATGLLAVPYPKEYLPSAPNGGLLSSLSSRTNGVPVQAPGRPISEPSGNGGTQELWWPLSLLALLVFLAGIAVGRFMGAADSEPT